jgi:hypothetical protein
LLLGPSVRNAGGTDLIMAGDRIHKAQELALTRRR